MKNKILLATGSLYNYGLSRVFKFASESGFDGIELVIDDCWDTRQVNYLKSLVKFYNLPIFSVHSAMEFVNSFGADPKEKLNKSIALAKEIDTPILVVHPSIAKQPEFYLWFQKSFADLEKQARNVKLAVENMPKAHQKDNNSKMVFENYDLEEFSSFNQINLDISHLATTDQNLLSVLDKIKSKLIQIHLSDSKRCKDPDRVDSLIDDHLIPGKGILPLKEFLNKLSKTNFKGNIVIELIPENINAGQSDTIIVDSLKKSIEYVKANY